MHLQLGKILSNQEIALLEPLNTYGGLRLFASDDNDGMVYIIAVDPNNMVCSCFEFVESPDFDESEEYQLARMYTLKALHRQGVGKEIMRQAVARWTVFRLPSTNSQDDYYYTEFGRSFIVGCFDKGILKKSSFTYPT